MLTWQVAVAWAMGARFDLAFGEVKKTWDQLWGGNLTAGAGGKPLGSNLSSHEEL